MKKKLLILIPVLLVIIGVVLFITLKKDSLFYLDNKYYGESSLTEIDSEKLNELEDDNASFVVLIYQLYCTTSCDLTNYVTEFLDDYNMSFYKILYSDIENTDIANYVEYCPSVVIYHNGEIVTYLDACSNDDIPYYQSAEGFKKWIEQYVVLEKKGE